MSHTLHLVRLRLDAQKLYAFAKRSRAAARELDEGYAVHAALAALFDHDTSEGERVAPKPFHIAAMEGRTLDVLGYAALDHVALAERAKAFADPLVWDVCDLDAMASKPMPTELKAGTRLGFEVRVCPIRRIAKKGPMTRERAEVDAFMAKAWEVGPDVQLDREEVYRAWLEEELGKENAARLLQASMKNFHLSALHRRTQGQERRGHRTKRPDVTFEGVLEVLDPAGFAARLGRGVGRHRSFGFGMLRLRPAPRD